MTPCKWHLVVCGINHKTSDLEDREPLQIAHEEMGAANAAFCDMSGVREAVVISTCNRIEFYFVADKDKDVCDLVGGFFRSFKDKDVRRLRDKFYHFTDTDAAEHLFRVAAGIDSMVIGENQIMSQVREAYRSACNVKSAGKIIHRLFHQAFRIGKQVRSDTELGKGACSVSSATVDMLKSRMSHLDDPTVLFVGVNRMINLAATGLHRRGSNNFLFANRTKGRAEELAARFKGSGYGLDDLPELLTQADIVVSCTGSDKAVITDDTLDGRVNGDSDRPLIIADMAIPRDVELAREHPSVTVYDLNDVQEYVKTSQAQREKAVPQAELLIKVRLEQFVYWYEQVQQEPYFNGMGDAFEMIRRKEMERVMKNLPEDSRDVVERATRRMVEKLLLFKVRSEASK